MSKIHEKLNNRLTTEEFTKRSKEKHGDKYNYNNVIYINNHTKVELFCKKHGSFFQMPQSHLCGKICAKCYHESCRLTFEDFLKRINKKTWRKIYIFRNKIYKFQNKN